MIKKVLISFLMLTFSMHSQQKKVLLKGSLIDSLGVVKNANIINLNTKQGTATSDTGVFEIEVFLGDSLRISSIQYITKKVVISKYNYDTKRIIISLNFTTYALKEFQLKKHNLIGRLSIDTKAVPISKRDSLLRNTMDFSKIDMSVIEAPDHIDSRVRPPMNNTDPTAAFVGAGVAAVMPFKYSERLWALRRKLAQKKAFPFKILNELGEEFFFKKLKIPVENYFHFLEYCNPLGIENLHQKGKLLEVIKILQEESISYLKIVKKE